MAPLWALGARPLARYAEQAVSGGRMRRWWTSTSLVLALVSGPVLAGDVAGTVRFTGPVPRSPPIVTTKDRSVCGAEVEDGSLLVEEGRLANAIVMAKGARAADAPVKVRLDQERCQYRPHVQVAPVGSTLEIVNGDPLLHSVHGWAGRLTRFDLVMPAQGMRLPAKLDKVGLIQIRCDVHAWMTAYVMVTDARAAVTGRDGTFTLRGVPAGSHQVTVWHERLGEKTVAVKVPERGVAQLDVTFDR